MQDYKENRITNKILQFYPVFILTIPLFFSFYHAIFDIRVYYFVAVFFLILNLEFLWSLSYHGLKAINSILDHEKRDYSAESENQIDIEEQNEIRYHDVEHFVIIPNYKENLNTLQDTLDSISKSNIANQISVILAMEEREEKSMQKAEHLCKKNSRKFKRIFYTIHPDNIPGEWKCKSANEQWAFTKLIALVEKEKIDPNKIILTVCDADSIFHQKYFDAVTASFCKRKDRYTTLWQPPILIIKNFFDLPVFHRVLGVTSALYECSSYMRSFDEFTLMSTYSLSFVLCQRVGGWDVDVVCDDWRMGLKCFFYTSGEAKIEPIMHPVMCYALQSETYWQTLKSRLDQAKRHALGIGEFCYFLSHVLHFGLWSKNYKLPDPLRVIKLWWRLTRTHLVPNVNFILGIVTLILFLTERFQQVISPNLLSILTYLTIAMGFIAGFGHFVVFNKILNYAFKEKTIHWYRGIQWCLETLIFGPPVTTVYIVYPTYFTAVQIALGVEQRFIVSQKPKEKVELQDIEHSKIWLLE